jgi:mannose-6-phosphate isomerase-like protein (cupin superfamily)
MTTSRSQELVVRADEAEYLPSIGHILLADSSATHGALSSHRVRLGRGADGAVPHQHRGAAELFFVLDGALDVLAGQEVLSVGRGDLLVVPPGLAHAFAARPDSTADALIVITPGVERFDYFRQVVQVREGRLPRQALLEQQDRFDTYFLDSAAWASARASSRASAPHGDR